MCRFTRGPMRCGKPQISSMHVDKDCTVSVCPLTNAPDRALIWAHKTLPRLPGNFAKLQEMANLLQNNLMSCHRYISLNCHVLNYHASFMNFGKHYMTKPRLFFKTLFWDQCHLSSLWGQCKIKNLSMCQALHDLTF